MFDTKSVVRFRFIWFVFSTDGLQAAQKKAAFIQSLKNFLGIGTGIFSTLIIGYLSDNYGRQLTLGIIILGEALRILALGRLYNKSLKLFFFILLQIGSCMNLLEVIAYFSDVTACRHSKHTMISFQ